MPLDPIAVAEIVATWEDVQVQRETGRFVGVSLCGIRSIYQRFLETGLITRRPGSRPSC